jgi:hypothetical protein
MWRVAIIDVKKNLESSRGHEDTESTISLQRCSVITNLNILEKKARIIVHLAFFLR